MSTTEGAVQRHPKGLYVLFATEMWERFSFYTMTAMFALYMRDTTGQGFGWSVDDTQLLYSNYIMCVYVSPIFGGWIADKKIGYRKSIMIGGVFFMAGHLLLSIRSMPAVYAALVCLVIGNGFFKPNVSAMVGNLYTEGSHLKDRAYNIFYMGINVGAFLAPVVAEFMKSRFGFHPAFAVAVGGMAISIFILWKFKKYIEMADIPSTQSAKAKADAAAVAADAPPSEVSHQDTVNAGRLAAMDAVPDWKRVGALIVIFAIVVVFWMVFHQNGSTLTYWADDNTDWSLSGTISNALNPFFVITLTFPLVLLLKWLDQRGKEPSTPTKMVIGMFLTGLSFIILFFAAKSGESMPVENALSSSFSFRVTDRSLKYLRDDGVPQALLDKLQTFGADGRQVIKSRKFASDGAVTGQEKLREALSIVLDPQEVEQYYEPILRRAYIFRVSPIWLILAYIVITIGELMLSPMGLSLVSKVAPLRVRGLMMGGWFAATAIGNLLTAIGVYWEVWNQSTFFIVLGGMAILIALVLLFVLRPLKKAMPGV